MIAAVPELLAARVALDLLAASNEAALDAIKQDGVVKAYPDIAPAHITPPFLTYSIGSPATVATPQNQPPAMVTVAFDVTCWKAKLAKEPLDGLTLAVMHALCGADLRGRSQTAEGHHVTFYYGGTLPVLAEAGDTGEFTRTATRFMFEMTSIG